jgi:hypothetical protein
MTGSCVGKHDEGARRMSACAVECSDWIAALLQPGGGGGGGGGGLRCQPTLLPPQNTNSYNMKLASGTTARIVGPCTQHLPAV